jgi:hypothetical protein
MTTVIIFSLLGGLLLISITLSSIAHSKQQALALKKSQLNQLTRHTHGLQETLNTFLQIDSSYDLILILHQQILSLLNKKLIIEPNDEITKNDLELQKLLNANYQKQIRENEINKAMPSDEAINLANFQLLEVTKLLQRLKLKKRLSPAKHSELTNHIHRLKLDIEVESHVAQANSYFENKDTVMMQSHLKQARESLRAFHADFPEKSQLIRELSARIKSINKTNTIIVDNNEKESADQNDANGRSQYF